MKYKGLQIYDIVFDEDSIFQNVAIVSEPAIEETFIQLSKEEMPVQLKLDEERRVVSGPVLIPDQPIYRNMGGKQFYIRFSKETIEKMAVDFFEKHRNTEGNVEHAIPVQDITYFESYLLNKERGISPVEFSSLPDGTWIMSAKVNNEDVWQLIKDGELTGFSIDVSKVSFKEEKEIDNLQDFLDYLKKNR